MSNRIKANPSFIVDGMLGSLARWLRLLGYDTLYCEDQPDEKIISATKSRILLTRDKELLLRARNQGLTAFSPGSPPKHHQLQRLKQEFGLDFSINPDQSRCPECNTFLSPTPPEDVEGKIPAGSLKRHQYFWQCQNPQCGKVYWQGRHWKRIRQTLEAIPSDL